MVEITLIIVSAVIGAGFATGAELVAFFGGCGLPPLIIAVMVAGFTSVLMSVLIFCKSRQTRVTKAIFTGTYFLIFIVMAAGLRHLAGMSTMIVSLVLCCLVVLWGMGGLLRINKYMMFFVLAILVMVCMGALFGARSSTQEPRNVNLLHGVWKALIYSGLNCCILDRTFTHLRKTNSRKKLLVAGVIAAVTIGALICLILTTFHHRGVSADMPILELSNNIITKIAVFFCILTSMMILLNNIAGDFKRHKLSLCGLICAIAFGFSFLGFRNLLGGIYHFIGIFMILYCGFLCLNRFIVHDSVDGLEIVQDK